MEIQSFSYFKPLQWLRRTVMNLDSLGVVLSSNMSARQHHLPADTDRCLRQRTRSFYLHSPTLSIPSFLSQDHTIGNGAGDEMPPLLNGWPLCQTQYRDFLFFWYLLFPYCCIISVYQLSRVVSPPSSPGRGEWAAVEIAKCRQCAVPVASQGMGTLPGHFDHPFDKGLQDNRGTDSKYKNKESLKEK